MNLKVRILPALFCSLKKVVPDFQTHLCGLKFSALIAILICTQPVLAEWWNVQHALAQNTTVEPGTMFLDGYEACDCEDDLACTLDICLNGGNCGIIISGDSCLITGLCWPNGTPNPENECHSCNSTLDQDDWSIVEDSSPCDDGLGCTETDLCVAGACQGSGNPCTNPPNQCLVGVGACTEQIGGVDCTYVPVQGGTPCDVGLFCTIAGICDGGSCSSVLRDCSGLSDQCNIGVCDEGAQACTAVPVEGGSPCDDGEICTIEDQCKEGVCRGSWDTANCGPEPS